MIRVPIQAVAEVERFCADPMPFDAIHVALTVRVGEVTITADTLEEFAEIINHVVMHRLHQHALLEDAARKAVKEAVTPPSSQPPDPPRGAPSESAMAAVRARRGLL